MQLLLIIIGSVIILWVLWKYLKPYFLKYDTTLFLTGGLGSGKTLTGVKSAIVCVRKLTFKVKWLNFKTKIYNKYVKIYNKRKRKSILQRFKEIDNNKVLTEKGKKAEKNKILSKLTKKEREIIPLPHIYSNLPIRYKRKMFGFGKKQFCRKLKPEHILLFEQLPEYSVVLVDEITQLLNQYDWKEKVVQDNFTEFITFFRHYIGGNFIITAQSTSEIVAPLRRKANQATWCFNHKKHLFGLFYTMECCDIMLSDDVSTTSTTQVSENTRKLYGLYPRKAYATRAYKYRYQNIKKGNAEKFTNLYTNEILRLRNYISPCDDTTTDEQRKKQWFETIGKKG